MANFPLPIKGISKLFTYDKSVPATSGYMNNTRGVGIFNKQVRLTQRPGLDKWGAGTQVGAAEQPVVAMCVVSSVV